MIPKQSIDLTVETEKPFSQELFPYKKEAGVFPWI